MGSQKSAEGKTERTKVIVYLKASFTYL